jgi:hemolysin activation/secretion protein
VLSFAYRLGYQGKINGTIPFYMLPYVYNSRQIRDGLGGAKTIRGILRNRIVGESFVYGNAEMRWKFLYKNIMNQNFYFALTGFADFGKVIGKYPIQTTNTEALNYLAKGDAENWHLGYGGGLYIVMNQNFVMAINYALAADQRDGVNGFYLGLDFLY